MRIRRCKTLIFEPQSKLVLDLPNLIDGGGGLLRQLQWVAYAGHLSDPIHLSCEEINILKNISEVEFIDSNTLYTLYDNDLVDRLISLDILVTENSSSDFMSRTIPWYPLAEIYYMHGRWDDVNLGTNKALTSSPEIEFISPNNIIPPVYLYEHNKTQVTVDLDTPNTESLDELLEKRETCRNFDCHKSITKYTLSKIMHRVWRVKKRYVLENGLEIVHKTSPAGGGIHATEAYLLIRNVDDIKPGIYHYIPTRHALEMLSELSISEIDECIKQAVAEQEWFYNAAVYVIMTARFDRLFWKYRNHSKAFRVCNLDVGHLSQTLYLCATDENLGVFISAAINEKQIEEFLFIDPVKEGIIAVAGFGPKQE